MATLRIEKTSETWAAITEFVKDSIGDDLLELSRPGISERASDVLRGRLELAHAILAAAEPTKPIVGLSIGDNIPTGGY